MIITASHGNDCQFCLNAHCDLIGYITMLNLFNNLLEVRYAGDYRHLREPAPAAERV